MHSYIKWLWIAIQVSKSLAALVRNLMVNWKVHYETKDSIEKMLRNNHVKITLKIFQGDSLSLLLFYVTITPINHAINQIECNHTTVFTKSKNMQLTSSRIFNMVA